MTEIQDKKGFDGDAVKALSAGIGSGLIILHSNR